MDPDQARQRLEDERARLEQVRETFVDEHLTDESESDSLGELTGGLDQHQADVGTETFEREKDLSILETVEAELADVEHALRRISEGTYGICEACGRPIDADRLEAMPAARLCVNDQAAAERQAKAAGAS
jgi:RNA polymerase-binding transcription factor DksA